MRKLILIVLLLAGAQTASAQNADRYRGGWRTDDSDPHTYEFSIRGERVRGIYCTLCSDATTLAFIDGTLGPDGITFVVTHVRPDGRTAYQDKASARFEGDRLIVSGTSGAPRGGKFQRTLYRDSRGPDPLPVPVAWLPDATGKTHDACRARRTWRWTCARRRASRRGRTRRQRRPGLALPWQERVERAVRPWPGAAGGGGAPGGRGGCSQDPGRTR